MDEVPRTDLDVTRTDYDTLVVTSTCDQLINACATVLNRYGGSLHDLRAELDLRLGAVPEVCPADAQQIYQDSAMRTLGHWVVDWLTPTDIDPIERVRMSREMIESEMASVLPQSVQDLVEQEVHMLMNDDIVVNDDLMLSPYVPEAVAS